jgi:asparagine synthase (glutamine-hydrolysing)
MCGVGGFLWIGGGLAPFEAERRLSAMIDVLRHRGPDDRGTWSDDVCGLAHARLSIIDLTPAGHQPMGSADGRVWVSFNGEIYNFMELPVHPPARHVRARHLGCTKPAASARP